MVRRGRAVLAMALFACFATAQPAAASGLWDELRRPLDLPKLGPGEACPVSPIDESVDWESINIFGGSGIGPGPVYPGLGFSDPPGHLAPTTPATDAGWFREKVFWYVAPSYRGPVLVRGARLDGPGRMQFRTSSPRRSPEMRIKRRGSSVSWGGRPQRARGVPSGVFFRSAPACYGVQVDGTSFSKTVVFATTEPE